MPDHVPAGLAPFATIEGLDGVTLPADQHDIWLWLHASSPDATFDLAQAAALALDGCATVVAEQPGFTYRPSRDLTGFEDGTENPPLDEAVGAAVVPAGEPGAGGSIVLVQRWVHDLRSFNQLDPPTRSRSSVAPRTRARSSPTPSAPNGPTSAGS